MFNICKKVFFLLFSGALLEANVGAKTAIYCTESIIIYMMIFHLSVFLCDPPRDDWLLHFMSNVGCVQA